MTDAAVPEVPTLSLTELAREAYLKQRTALPNWVEEAFDRLTEMKLAGPPEYLVRAYKDDMSFYMQVDNVFFAVQAVGRRGIGGGRTYSFSVHQLGRSYDVTSLESLGRLLSRAPSAPLQIPVLNKASCWERNPATGFWTYRGEGVPERAAAPTP